VDSLLERESVLAELTRLARQVARGAGQMVLLRGEAGVGKTAVIRRFTAGLRAPIRVLWGWCDPLSAPRPLGPLVDMLAGLAGDAVAGQLGAAIHAGNTEGVYTRLPRLFGRGTWVCVIEDVHWADGATLDLLRFLARRVDNLPLLLVVSYRDDELGEQHPLAVALGNISMCVELTRIELAPLSMAAVAQLAAGSAINADELHRLTGGNPFFVTEILAAGADALRAGALPRSVSEAVRGRLARLSPAARETAHAAALCGPRPGPALAEAVCSGAAALHECLDAGVLVADGDTVGFRHELARRAALEQIPDYQRRVLHKRALIALAEPPVNPDALAALVFHAERAGDTDAVIRYGPPAAKLAATLGANREAADLYAMALRHAHSTPAEQKVVWLEGHALTSYLSGLAEPAVWSFRLAITLRRELGDRLGEGEDLRWLSHVLWPLGRGSEATEAGLASLRLLEDLGPTPQLAWSLVNLAHLSAHRDGAGCFDYAARAIVLGRQLDLPAVVIRARGFAAMARVLRTDTGWDDLEAAWREAMATESCQHGGLMGVIICWIAALHHHLDRAGRYSAEALAFCRDHDLGLFQAFVTGTESLAALYRGEWAHATDRAEDVLTRPWLPALHRILPLISVALVGARRGERPIAALLDEALGCAEHGNFRLPVWAARAEAAWLAGDDDTARAEADAGLTASTETSGDPWLAGPLLRWAHLSGGALDTAQPAVDAATPYHLEVIGDWQAAAAEWARRGCPYDAALAQLGGDIGAVETALATFRGLGAGAAAHRARQRLAMLRGRSPDTRHSYTSADPHGLTRREREVLDLLAAGHSDTEIAAALYLSPRTVNNHVGAILVKLGVHSRKQAAPYAKREAKP
jgi:DNA-binding CsgD family transcriptional regulator